jgi:predicted ATPase
MTISERIDNYKQIADNQRACIAKLKKELAIIGTLRLVIFVAGALCIYATRHNTPWLLISIFASSLVFIWLVNLFKKRSSERESAVTLLKIAENELKAFNYDFSAFDGASERINHTHDFSFDLDIFGDQSIFQMLNRTSMTMGKQKLADFIENPLHNKDQIINRQEAIKELTDMEDFRLDFRVNGSICNDAFSSVESVNKAFQPVSDKLSPLWKALCVLVPVLYLVYLILWIMNIASGSIFVWLFIGTLALSYLPMKKINQLSLAFDKKTQRLEVYARLFELIEKQSFKSELLQQAKQQIINDIPSARAIKKLAAYYHNLDMSLTFPINFIINPFLLANVFCALKIERWLDVYSLKTSEWFDSLASMDAFVSMSTFTADHPDYHFPEITDEFYFEGHEMGHPLIHREQCVRNDINITRNPYFMIVTGANMAGKSTYLRTVGVNHILASIGAPVCAESMKFYPGRLLTNLRTADSLVNNESYFFAELKRLKMIIDRLESGEQGLFIILDEILKGTNSEDKQKGSFALMKRLVNLGANGIIATHDLVLGDLENEYPESIQNFHFDATIVQDILSFNYKLTRGIATTMNASFLMKKMGITE